MTRDQRKQLLEYVSSGLDVEAAAVQIGLSMREVRKAGVKYAQQLDEAYGTGSARLRGRLLKAALTTDDLKVIQNLLEQRAITEADKPLERIERIIINPPCWKCHAVQPLPSAGLPTARKPINDQAPSNGKSNGEAKA